MGYGGINGSSVAPPSELEGYGDGGIERLPERRVEGWLKGQEHLLRKHIALGSDGHLHTRNCRAVERRGRKISRAFWPSA